MKKRILSLILAVLTVLSLCAPALASDMPAAAASGSCGTNVKWSLSSAGTLTISGTGPMKNYSWNASPPWSSSSRSVKKLVIQDGVTTIGDYAFTWLGVSSVTIPDSVVSVGDNAFENSSLTSVTVPGSVRSIGDFAFSSCYELTKVTLSNGVTSIGESAFNGTRLASITIPQSLTSIGYFAFGNCALTSITVNSGNSSYAAQNGVLFNKAKTKLIKYPEKKSGAYTIPGTVKSIEDGAFAGCCLTSVTIPTSVTSIGYIAFDGCVNLTRITIPASVTSLGEGVFGMSGLKDITILNPKCTIKSFGMLGDVTVRGYTGSTAQTFAKRWGYTFKPLDTVKKGWVTEGGKKYYYQNGAKLKGLYIIDGQRYYFSVKDGAMLTGIVTVDNAGHKSYFSAKDGHRITGVVTVDNKGHQCYFSAKTGYQLKGLVTTDAKGTQRYFSVKTGYMLKNGWYNIGGGKKALINASGVVTKITKI